MGISMEPCELSGRITHRIDSWHLLQAEILSPLASLCSLSIGPYPISRSWQTIRVCPCFKPSVLVPMLLKVRGWPLGNVWEEIYLSRGKWIIEMFYPVGDVKRVSAAICSRRKVNRFSFIWGFEDYAVSARNWFWVKSLPWSNWMAGSQMAYSCL